MATSPRATAETFQYDAIGRLTSRNNDLGTFTLGYLGRTGQTTSRQRAGSTVATTWSYLPNSGDRRLAGINNTGHVAGHFSNFTLATTPENFISSITETSNTAVAYPAAGTQTASFDNLNQMTAASGQAFTYDANGNLLSDGQRVYTWDAEDRLTGITYPGQPGKVSAFSYDGLGRRVAITETPAGGGTAVTTRYLWCSGRLCQARDGANTVTRGYYAEGEFIPGGASAYYGVDQIGSVRRAFVSASTAPAYGYDPYGQALGAAVALTDFGYAGMYRHGASGLYLTWFRAYDAGTGRWLSRDPVGEGSDRAGNLYPYVGGNPVSEVDPSGRLFFSICFLVPSACRPPPSPNVCRPGPGGVPGLQGGMANAPPSNQPTVPPNADKALEDIDNGVDRPNVRNPKAFANDGRGGTPQLPNTTPDGQPIDYTEHTLNPRPPGGTLDGERIVTGSDGSAWYTPDHFINWIQMR